MIPSSLEVSIDEPIRGLARVALVGARPPSYPEAAMMAHVRSSEELMARHLAPPAERVVTLGCLPR